MAVPASLSSNRAPKTTGLRHWMQRVLVECDKVSADFSPDPVHDLRVALRRCRSLADGLMALDPGPEWKAMKKAGKRLFQSLGDLRDTHVIEEWVEKLEKIRAEKEPPSAISSSEATLQARENQLDSPFYGMDEPAQALLRILKEREADQKSAARSALEKFDRKQWRRWVNSLPVRGARTRPGGPLFKHLALERWTEARALHARAMRSRSQTALHSLRIGIKRFRYIVENFLPLQHQAWSDDIKEMQDLLGEIHDLDVLWATAVACRVLPDQRSQKSWHERILAQRTLRADRYRSKMTGPNSLWDLWRAELPQGKEIQVLATRRLVLWAKRLDPDFSHSAHVARLALQLYRELSATGFQPMGDIIATRASLYVAAVLHDVGKSKGEKNHHKKGFKLIQAHGTPLGWKPVDYRRAALAARFHRGALPTRRHALLSHLPPEEQRAIFQLTAILRLANALDAEHDGRIGRIQVENRDDGKEKNSRNGPFPSRSRFSPRNRNAPLVIAAEGYAPMSPTARAIAAERHLLETVIYKPVMMKTLKQQAESTHRRIR